MSRPISVLMYGGPTKNDIVGLQWDITQWLIAFFLNSMSNFTGRQWEIRLAEKSTRRIKTRTTLGAIQLNAAR